MRFTGLTHMNNEVSHAKQHIKYSLKKSVDYITEHWGTA